MTSELFSVLIYQLLVAFIVQSPLSHFYATWQDVQMSPFNDVLSFKVLYVHSEKINCNTVSFYVSFDLSLIYEITVEWSDIIGKGSNYLFRCVIGGNFLVAIPALSTGSGLAQGYRSGMIRRRFQRTKKNSVTQFYQNTIRLIPSKTN